MALLDVLSLLTVFETLEPQPIFHKLRPDSNPIIYICYLHKKQIFMYLQNMYGGCL
jgi:hypothetical protein